jgi:hypothetical protein
MYLCFCGKHQFQGCGEQRTGVPWKPTATRVICAVSAAAMVHGNSVTRRGLCFPTSHSVVGEPMDHVTASLE